MRKKLLALLLAAAMAISLLAGCGGGKSQSLSQMLLNLLDGQYQNVSVEIDSDLEAKLRQAISQSDTDEELRAALEQLLGGEISFQRLGSGQQGDTAWTLIIYPGTDPDAAARSVYLDLDKVFAALPADGVYSSGFAMAEMENGYAILVRATVDKAGTEDKPDPVTLESIKVTKDPKLEYWVGESFDPKGMVITATYSNGTTKTLKDIKQNGDQGVKWTPDGALTTVGTQDITITYGGKTATVKVTVKEPEVEKIEVTKQPNQIEYNIGASFNPTGMVITATYSDNVKTETIDINYEAKGVTWKPTTIAADTKEVTIKYQGKEAEVPITLTPPTLEGIKVDWSTEATYYMGDSITKSGVATVTANYSYGVDKTLNPNEYKLTIQDPGDSATTKEITDNKPYTFTTAGEYTLTVTYDKYQDKKTIKVEDIGYTISDDGSYYVSNENGLLAWNEAAQSDPSLNCTLTENINLTGQKWTPVGMSINYSGTFDGQGHTITGLNISSSSEAVALFGDIGAAGKVMNLQLKDVTYNGSTAMGGIAHGNNGTITACSVTGTLTNTTNNGAVGGIAAINYGTITACWFNGTITGGSNACGITVFNLKAGSYDGKITACYWSGDGISNGVWGGNDISGTTKVDNSTVTWQTAVGGMNAALTGNDYQWALGTGILPTLKKQ